MLEIRCKSVVKCCKLVYEGREKCCKLVTSLKSERAKCIWDWYRQCKDQKLTERIFSECIKIFIYNEKEMWLKLLVFDNAVDLSVFTNNSTSDSFAVETYSFEDMKECIDVLDSLLVLKEMNID